MIDRRLTTWAEENGKLCKEQFGFRRQKSTTDCIFILHSMIQLSFSRRKPIYGAFVDYARAFDSTNHDGLWYKVHRSGVSSKILNIIRSLYSKIKLCVRADLVRNDTRESDDYFFKPQSGVLQGEVISAFLFTLFVNDLPSVINSPDDDLLELCVTFLMYADDMCCLSTSREGLQATLNQLSEYCDKWGLTVNTGKTKCIAFRRNGRFHDKDKWTYKNEPLETVKEFRYLGYTFSSSGSFCAGTKYLRMSALKAMFHVRSFCYSYCELSIKT